MKVFISWSGEQSRRVGEELKAWLPRVLQAVKPWFSPKDLGKGQPWAEQLMAELASVKVGIFCLVPGNVEKPWIAFEASACMKAGGRVFTFLHGVDYPEVTGPLAIFNHSKTDREGTWRMLEDINKLLPEPLAPDVLKDAFDEKWPKLEAALGTIKPDPTRAAPLRGDSDVLREVLEIVRGVQSEMARRPGHRDHEADPTELVRAIDRYEKRLDAIGTPEVAKRALALCVATLRRSHKIDVSLVAVAMQAAEGKDAFLAKRLRRLHDIYTGRARAGEEEDDLPF